MYVEDVAEIYEILARELSINKKLSGNVFNAGTNEIFKVKDVINKIFTKNKNKSDLKKNFSKITIKKLKRNKKSINEL